MPSEPRPSFYTLTTTDGRQATIYAAPDADPWQAATQYARASFARDSQLAELRIASPAEIAALSAQQPDPAAVQPPEPGSEAALSQPLPLPDAPAARGFKLDLYPAWRKPQDHPAWATRPQQETWRSGVLVLWDHELRRIAGLSAKQALAILDQLQASADWRQEGVILGRPMTRLVLGQPDRSPEHVLVDQIRLSPAETADLLELLRSNEPAMRNKAEAEDADKRRRLGQVYMLLLDLANQRRARLAHNEIKAELPVDPPSQTDPC